MYPDGPQLKQVSSNRTGIELVLSVKDFRHAPFSTASDAEGKELVTSSWGMGGVEEGSQLSLSFDTTSYSNPIRIELTAYPTYIEGHVKVEVK
ncbi:hypothetical protein [Sporosarcina sp. A2]|uniref:hypothetical protein n=1 Tax=Sporosarcina sp. A2 TaxID=3393449 RepID=UPI003D7A843F